MSILRRLAIPVALTALYAALPSFASARWLAPIAIFFLLTYTILLPGWALTRFFRAHPSDAFEAIALWAVHGLGVLMAFCFLWAISGVSLDIARWVLAAVVLVLATVAPAQDDSRPATPNTDTTPGEKKGLVVLAVVTLLTMTAVFAAGPMTDFQSDSIDHIGYVEEIARTGEAFPTTAFYKDPGADGADLRKNFLHAAYGLFKVQTGVDTTVLFACIGAFLIGVAILAVYTSAVWMFYTRAVGIVSAILFVVSYRQGLVGDFLRSAYYPNRFGVAVLLMFIAAAALAMRGRRPLWLCSVYAFTAVAIHMQYAVLVALVVGVMALWKTCSVDATWPQHIRRTLTLAFAAGAACAPVFLYRFFTAYQRNELHDQLQGVMFYTEKWFASDPIAVWHWVGPVGVAALVASVVLWPLRKKTPGVGYTSAALLTMLFIHIVPFVFTPLYHKLSYLVFRIDRAVPFYMLTAFVLANPRALPAVAWQRRTTRAIAVIAVLLAALPLLRDNTFSRSTIAQQTAGSHTPWADALATVSDAIPGRAVIASDPVTSYVISGFTRHFVICTLDQHAPPNDTQSADRMQSARTILSPYSTASERIAGLAKFNATHIVLNQNIGGMLLNYWSMTPETALDVEAQLRQRPDLFEEVASDGGLVAFRWTGKAAGAADSIANPFLVKRIPDDVTIIGNDAGEARLEGARLSADSLARGDQLEVALFWSRAGEKMPANYVVTLRFDRLDTPLPLGGRPFTKLARKLKERLDGQRYRFRRDHMMSNGFFGPDAWPGGAVVIDRATARIPSDVAPGRYIVRAKMIVISNVPNHALRDFFFDDDIYNGVAVGRVSISP